MTSIVQLHKLIDTMQDRLYRLALGIVGRNVEAEDVVQEVFIKAWEQRSQWAGVENMEAWLYRMTQRHAIDKTRSAFTKRTRGNDVSVLGEKVSGVEGYANSQQVAEESSMIEYIRNCMVKLTEPQRLVMQLRDIEGYSYDEIAEALAMPLGQVKTHLHRARKHMQELVDRKNIQA